MVLDIEYCEVKIMDSCAHHFEKNGLNFNFGSVFERKIKRDEFYSNPYLEPMLNKLVRLNKLGYSSPPTEVKV